MKTKILATASILALMAAAPATADTAKTDDSAANSTTEEVTEDVKEGWDKTKEAVKETAEDASQATQEAYRDMKGFVFSEDEDKLDIQDVRINPRAMATNIIGEPVYNPKEERVGVIKDVILDQDGKAVMVVVGDGDFFGLGKLAAFDYGSMVKMNADGDIVMPITEEAIEQAAEFTYDEKAAGDKMLTMSASGYSVEKLLDANLVNAKGEKVGDIDDITFTDGKASQLIVGVDKILGLGGEEISLPYDTAKVITVEDEFEYQLSAKKASLITNYKSAPTN
ncbi:PRC-barrel domain-containing protein [Sneathiella sp.]|uniref:PRC-barrel domain-containing protein n=1 Tax=Sneathiella sp. TaxID=1964365 RepID=UPI00262C9E96|nr:PRC-barrel domain-containing protein [Sneathiella sp.]MDF2368227.1 PRC-barrel domain-containing protein [Sneathiella sp.]